MKKFNSFIRGKEKTLTDFKLWAYKIATYEIFNYRKRNKQSVTFPLDYFPNLISKADEIENAFLKIFLQQIICMLSDEEKVLLKLKVYENLTFREISEITGENINTLISRFSRLLKKLSRNL